MTDTTGLTHQELLRKLERLEQENKQLKAQDEIERNFYPLYVAIRDAWMHAKSNEDCARILRLFCTDLEGFQQEFPHGERRYRKGSQADKLRQKKAQDDPQARADQKGEAQSKT